MKIIKYFLKLIIIYIFFIIGRSIGLTLSRKLFSYIFKKLGPFVRSKKIINKNLENFQNNISNEKKKEIISDMWSNYGMTFIEYVYLNKFKNQSKHIQIEGENILKNLYLKNKPLYLFLGILLILN